MRTLPMDACPHWRWCTGKRAGDHDASCPTLVLRLSDADVDAFCAQYVRLDVTAGGPRMLRGDYNGITASTSLGSDPLLDAPERRWIAEELLHAERINKAGL